MNKVLVIDHEKCVGCRTCEMVCSLSHVGEVDPYRSIIIVVKFEDKVHSVPVNCRQCEDAPCVKTCPQRAISHDEKLIRTTIDYSKCIGCRFCVFVCPFGGMSFQSRSKRVVKCDLCGGDPWCARFCAYDALKYTEADELNTDRMIAFSRRILNENE